MAVLLIALTLFACGGLIHWWGLKDCERHYQKEILYWAEFQVFIVQERLEMAASWAAEDLALLSAGRPARGCPLGTPIQTLKEYERIMEDAPVPVEIPAWKTTKVPTMS